MTAEEMELLVRRYFDACNAADADAIASCFIPDAVHYFPPGMYGGPFRGAGEIARQWVSAVDRLGSVWTVDSLITSPATNRAVMEWTHFKVYESKILRGDEWYEFDPDQGLIKEIRAYYASPQAPELDRLELGGFDYANRAYALAPPIDRVPQ